MEQAFNIRKEYQEIRLISRGAIGEVYQGMTRQGIPVAIKRLRPHLAYDRLGIDKFIKEARILKTLDYPAFPKLIKAFSEDEEAYLVMEWLEGKPLQEYFGSISEKALREKEVAIFALSLLSAISYLQQIKPSFSEIPGLIHADLNPKNVLVGKGSSARIFDFTHAVWLAEGGVSLGGTWAYMHLKQMVEKKLTLQTDLFAAGLLIYEALTGKALLDGETKFDIFVSTKGFKPETAAAAATEDPILKVVLESLFRSIDDPSVLSVSEILFQLKRYLSAEAGSTSSESLKK